MDGTKTTTNWIIAGLVALVVIIGGGWLIARERSGTMADTNATSTETAAAAAAATSETSNASESNAKPTSKTGGEVANPTTTASGETISVSDQPAGSSVTVASVSVSKPTWVAVRDSRPWYLGWKLVTSGETNVMVPLQRNTVAGTNYEVVLFVDDGDGQFAIHGGDHLVTTAEGAPVSATFTAQ